MRAKVKPIKILNDAKYFMIFVLILINQITLAATNIKGIIHSHPCQNNLTFKTSKDLADNFTEYYDFVYQYITDCLSIDLNYRKTFYSDGNIEPDETLSFLLRIIPFTEFGVPNIGNVINK